MRYLFRAITAVTALTMIGVATPVAAAEPEVHCVARASVEAPQALCFDSFDKALQFVSGGVLIDMPKGSGTAATAAKVEAVNSAADEARAAGILVVRTVISVEYTGSNFTGSDLIWYGTSGNCSTPTGNVDYYTNSMPTGWNNVITSYRTYANCWDKHYESTFQGGASIGYLPTDAYIGAVMDNQTNSQEWS